MTPERRRERMLHSWECRRKRLADPVIGPVERAREAARMRQRREDPAIAEQSRNYMRRKRTAAEFKKSEAEKMKRCRQKHIARFLVRGAKNRAKKYGHDFNLTVEWAEARWNGFCELTGIAFDWSKGRVNIYSPSIDKIDPSVGYVQSNCRFILASVNALKSSATDAEMYAVASALLNRRTAP